MPAQPLAISWSASERPTVRTPQVRTSPRGSYYDARLTSIPRVRVRRDNTDAVKMACPGLATGSPCAPRDTFGLKLASPKDSVRER